MAVMTRSELAGLMKVRDEVCLSLYMPTHKKGAAVQQNPVRFKNMLVRAEEQLTAAGMRSPEAQRFLEPARAYLENTMFWQHQSEGLALFRSPGELRLYRVPLRFEELIMLDDRFYIKPLLRVFSASERFYLLAVSLKQARFFQGTREGLRQLEPAGMPRGMEEVLKYEDIEKQLQWHTRATPPGRGERPAMFHGIAEWKDEVKARVLQYLRKVDQALHGVLREESAPLIFAGVTPLFALYREANTYHHLVDRFVEGNPDHLRPHELLQRVEPVVREHAEMRREEAGRRYREQGSPGLATSDLRSILPAAYEGRVHTLFIAVGEYRWGTFDPQDVSVELHEVRKNGDHDLLDQAAVFTLSTGGTVYPVPRQEVPGGSMAAALLRY
ncbi:MAG: hypothetical protein ACOC8N_01160 [Spirochaetota bacterium]